ncbi:hypothetical protein [Desulfosporosinus sp.]|uniref:hypothetical protein n=1 Tax=Desulfosporosinus sp. TaxID=157907 RepID=UPI0025C180A5|nr:hypothetical protein [Desulfosporosinus sp.]MBC2727238.1 hypothetical protein [Desulfosporosinus sp.]
MSLPDENSLLSLFECEPKLLDSNVPFFYNEATYEFYNNNHERFLVSICPAYKDIKILVFSVHSNELLQSLNLKSVKAIEIVADRRDESKLMISFEGGSIIVNFKPRFKVLVDYANYP